jgi:hypothetical protein
MSITTVAELRTALGVGTLYTDAVIQSVCDAADNVLLPMLWKNQQYIVAHGNVGTVGTLYFNDPIMDYFYGGFASGEISTRSKPISSESLSALSIAVTPNCSPS